MKKIRETAEEIYKKKDWKLAQELYDSGLVWRDLQAKGYNSDALVWARENGLLIMRTAGESYKLNIKLGKITFEAHKTPAFRKLMAKNGGLRANAGRCKTYRYHSITAGEIYVNGTWELQFVVYLESQGINWKRNTLGFEYKFGGKVYKYYPDFYLPDTDTYIEVKGYKTPKDVAKWKQFDKKLEVYNKERLATTIVNFKAGKRQVDILELQNTGLSVELTGLIYKKVDKRSIRTPFNLNRSKPKKNWESFGDLTTRVWETPLEKLGKELGVSDVGLKKYCKRNNILLPPKGYWRRRESGYTHEQALTRQRKVRTWKTAK